jgi:hypothetical protein
LFDGWENAYMDQRTQTPLVRQRGHPSLPQWRTALLILAFGTLFLACISLGVSVLAYRPNSTPQSALNDGTATLAFFLNGVPLTKPN